MRESLRKSSMLSQLQDFKEGKLSIGRLAEVLEVPVAEALSLVAQYTAHPRMPPDYLADALETARGLHGR